MSKQGIYQFSFIMLSLLFVSVGYNNCSDKAFEFQVAEEQAANPDGLGGEQPVAAPRVLINNNADYTNSDDVNLSLSTGPIDATEMFISNDDQCSQGSWEPFQKNKAWVLSEKNKEVRVYAKYRIDGEDETQCVTDSIIHDDIAPTVAITTQTQNGWVASRNLNVVYTAEDSGSGIALTECARDNSGNFNPCGQIISFFNLEENKNYVMVVQATDRAGNRSEPKQLNWATDLTPPEVVFNLTPSLVTADVTPDFAYTATDAGSGVQGYECRLDDQAAFTACQNALTLSGLADGSHTLRVRASDNLGHMSDEVSYTWTQDSQAPTVMFVSTPDLITNSSQATFAFQGLDGGNPITQFQCKLVLRKGFLAAAINIAAKLIDQNDECEPAVRINRPMVELALRRGLHVSGEVSGDFLVKHGVRPEPDVHTTIDLRCTELVLLEPEPEYRLDSRPVLVAQR